MNNKEKIKKLIFLFEEGKLNVSEAVSKINEISVNKIDANELISYWKHSSMEQFINQLLITPIGDWKEIDDERAIFLIKEIISNLDKDEIIKRNSEALEKKYGKVNGTISDLIFIDDIIDPDKILTSLKKQNIINL